MHLIRNFMRRCRLSLGVKFVLITVAILSLTMSVAAVLRYHEQQQYFHDNLTSKARTQAKFVAAISIEALLSYDYVTLNRFMWDTSQIEDIVYAVILSADDKPLTSYLDRKDPYITAALRDTAPDNIAAVLAQVDRDPMVLVITEPITLDDKVIATLRIGVDRARLTELARHLFIRQLLESAAIIAVLGLCLYVVFRYSTLLPVKLLSGGAERVARGDLGQDVAVYSHDELGQLTQSFNAMMHRLKASVTEKDDALAQLRDLNRSLNARVAERTARLELAQKIAHMGHWDVPADANALQVSAQVYSILGVDPGAVLTTRALLRRVHPDDRTAVLLVFARGLARPSVQELEFRVRRSDGDERWLTLTVDAGDDHARGGPRLSGIVQDITERKRAELVSQAALVDKINAESANAAKSAFLATMSHEIRTPLTAILGFAEFALERRHPENQRADALHTIIRNGRHLLHVINEILDFSKIESKNLVIERLRTPLFQVIADVTSLMGMQAREKGLSCTVEYAYPLPAYVTTDPTRLKQILLNLCANAIKFTHQGGVRLELAYDPASRRLRLSIVDSGIGIHAEEQIKLFQPFSQADSSTTRRFGGTGLGLYISRQLAEKLGGGISIQSISGLGTRMDVTIDAGAVADADLCTEIPNAAPAHVVVPPAGAARSLRGRVLLAEDSPDNQRLISLYVQEAGAEITIVNNGQRAVETALADNFDLVLMDMQMPVMDGISATEWLRRAGYAGPVVAITANAMKEDQQRCLEAGCDGFLTKPIDTAAFRELLARYLAPAGARTVAAADTEFSAEMRALTAQFMDGLPGRVQGMQQALDDADDEQLRRATHQLKGIAGTHGCPEITAQAAQLERDIKSNDRAAVRATLATLMMLTDAAVGRWRLQNTIDPRAFDAPASTGGARP
jgi:PAS domain S-box-containing protein